MNMKNTKLIITWRRFHERHLSALKLKFVQWLDVKYPGKYCWADCVTWSIASDRINPFKIDSSKSCEIESLNHQSKMCYCGGWQEGKCYALLPKEVRDKMEAEAKEYRELHANDEIPF